MKKLLTILLMSMMFIGCQKDEVGQINQNDRPSPPSPPSGGTTQVDECHCGTVESSWGVINYVEDNTVGGGSDGQLSDFGTYVIKYQVKNNCTGEFKEFTISSPTYQNSYGLISTSNYNNLLNKDKYCTTYQW